MYPFVCLAIAGYDSPEGQLVYTILQDTITDTDPYVGTAEGNIPKYTLRKGASTNLNVMIPEGTIVAIVLGWRGEGVTSEQYGSFSVFGGIFVE